AKREFVAGHRLEGHDYEIFGALPGGADREFGITAGVETGIATHAFFEALPLIGLDVRRIVQGNETGVALFQVERFDKAMEPKPVDRVFAGEQRPQRVQDVAIGVKTTFNVAVRVRRLALEPQPGDVLDRVPAKPVQEKGGGDADGQYQPCEHGRVKNRSSCPLCECDHRLRSSSRPLRADRRVSRPILLAGMTVEKAGSLRPWASFVPVGEDAYTSSGALPDSGSTHCRVPRSDPRC